MIRQLLPWCALGLMSCALPENFVPAERSTGLSPDGHLAADYDVAVDGQRLGDVSVWTDGAESLYRDDRTVLHVTFQVDNVSEIPIEIVPNAVQLRAGDRIVRPRRAELVYGERIVPPGEIGLMVLRFTMPEDVDPQDLDAFEIDWEARAGELVYAQRTPFLEIDGSRYAYPVPLAALP
jgi:hypothetical protein